MNPQDRALQNPESVITVSVLLLLSNDDVILWSHLAADQGRGFAADRANDPRIEDLRDNRCCLRAACRRRSDLYLRRRRVTRTTPIIGNCHGGDLPCRVDCRRCGCPLACSISDRINEVYCRSSCRRRCITPARIVYGHRHNRTCWDSAAEPVGQGMRRRRLVGGKIPA
jgi:hypothetical protein